MDEMNRRARQRRHWTAMGFLPGILALPLFWTGIIFWAIFPMALFWNGYCAVKLVATESQWSRGERIGAGVGWYMALAIFNTVLGFALIAGSCALSGNYGH